MNSKKEKIILTQIKQDFTTPVDAISDYINLIIDGSDIYDDCLLYTSPSPRDDL